MHFLFTEAFHFPGLKYGGGLSRVGGGTLPSRVKRGMGLRRVGGPSPYFTAIDRTQERYIMEGGPHPPGKGGKGRVVATPSPTSPIFIELSRVHDGEWAPFMGVGGGGNNLLRRSYL